MTPDQIKQALENCSKDPIHIPGTIQSFGALIATDGRFETVTHASSNIADLFEQDLAQVIGGPISNLLSVKTRHKIANVLGHDTIETQREILPSLMLGKTSHQMSLHRKGDQIIIELVPEPDPSEELQLPLEHAKAMMSMPLDSDALLPFLREATERMRIILGMDRVKFYGFLPDGGGEVLAEARHPDMPSFLGLRFPAEDIPQIARTLYAKTPIRIVHDVVGPDTAVLGLPEAEPLDMSLAVLRGKDKVHQQYLINMGVASTLTVPVVVDGVFWGMFAAHHRSVRQPDPAMLNAAELSGKLISLRIQHAVERRRQSILIACTVTAKKLVVTEDSLLSTGSYWEDTKASLAEMFRADGIAFFVEKEINTHGTVPEHYQMQILAAMVSRGTPQILTMDDLNIKFQGADWGDVGGAMLITVPGPQKVQLFIFRNRIETKVNWAGRPEKTTETIGNEVHLTPRKSFETYLETVENQSEEWTTDDIEIGNALSQALTEAVLAQSDILTNRHRMGLMVRELNHRVRNILALVQSISQQSREDAQSVSAYAQALEERVIALSGAHNLLTHSEMTGAVLSDLIGLITKPYATTEGRCTATGPLVTFRPDAASILALLFHELASNAAKYGAFSAPAGQVIINWKIEGSGILITWTEKNGPPVSPPSKSGFGRSIISGAIPYEFKGTADLDFLPEGFVGTFWLPGNLIVDAAVEPVVNAPPPTTTVTNDEPLHMRSTTLRALVVEDNFIVASAAKRLLFANGFANVDAAATVEEALSYISQTDYDFCMLDINLQGQLSRPVAQRLTTNNIPFVFASGYGSAGHDIVDTYDVPLLAKPLDAKSLINVLKILMQDT